MSTPLVKTSFDGMKEIELNDAGDAAIDGILGNTKYADGQNVAKAADEIRRQFKECRREAANGNKVWIERKKQIIPVYQLVLRRLASMANALWAGNKEMLQESNIEMVKENSSKKDLEAPAPPVISYGATATELEGKATKTVGAQKTAILITKGVATKTSVWTRVPCKYFKCTFTGLEANTKYSFKLEVTGSDSKVLCSDVITIYTPNEDE